MLPRSIEELTERFRMFPGVGYRSSQKLSLDVLSMDNENFENLLKALIDVRDKVKFCENCGFFAEQRLCNICLSKTRNTQQICLVERPTDVISLERSEIYRGVYHVLNSLISPLDNIFPEDTTLNDLLDRRLKTMIEKNLVKTKKSDNNFFSDKIELILFFKAGFASEATTAYLKESIEKRGFGDYVKITRLAQGLPLYYNPDTLDQATMVKALEDRKELT